MSTRIGIFGMVAALLAWASPVLAEGTGSAGGQQGQRVGDELSRALQKLHAANQAEVKLGQVAEQQAQSREVKQFARDMVEQHQRNDERLQQVAQQLGVRLEGEQFRSATKESQEKLRELQQKRGAEFDRAYTEHMVKDHESDLKEVHDAAMKAGAARNDQLAAFLGETEATLHQHHARAAQTRQQVQGQSQQQRQGRATPDQPGGRGKDSGGLGSGRQQQQGERQ